MLDCNIHDYDINVCAQIKSMTDRDLARLWSQYVKELAVLLVRAEGNHPPEEVVERMQELVQRELLLLYMRWATLLQSDHSQASACCVLGHLPPQDMISLAKYIFDAPTQM